MKRDLVFWIALGIASVAAVSAGLAEAQDGLTRRNSQGPVGVTLTLVPPVESGSPVRVKVVLDTHSGSLDGIAFESAMAIRKPDGSELAPSVVEQSGGGHHRQAVVVFPAVGLEKAIEIVVRDVGGVRERSFRWELPLSR